MNDHATITVAAASKTFTLHTQAGVRLPVFSELDLTVRAGECVALHGPSGAGKSTLLRALYANYLLDSGSIRVRHAESDGRVRMVDLATATPRQILAVRRRTIGYVSQFLRVIPRVSALDVVAEPARGWGVAEAEARATADALLARLNIPERLRALAPATFSGGEQQRVNIARGFAVPYPVLLLDEPTASLDAKNREIVMHMILEAKHRGAAVVGIFHDEDVRARVADRLFTLDSFKSAA